VKSPTPISNQLITIHKKIKQQQIYSQLLQTIILITLPILPLNQLNKISSLQQSTTLIISTTIITLALTHLIYNLYKLSSKTDIPSQLASQIEHHHPQYMDSLNCAIEIETKPSQTPLPLKTAILTQVQQKLKNHNPYQTLLPKTNRPIYQIAKLILAAILIPLTLNTTFSKKTILQCKQLLNLTPPSLTITPKNIEIPYCQDIKITAQIHHWQNQAQIQYQTTHTPQTYPMLPQANRTHTITLYNISQASKYRIITPSLTSPWYTITPYHPPQIKQASLTITPPSYTNLPPKTYPTLQNQTAITNSTITITLQHKPTITPALYSNNKKIPIYQPSPKTSTFTTILNQNQKYTLTIHDSYSHQTTLPTFTITAKPDLKPIIEIYSPNKDTNLTPNTTQTIKARATDDLAIQTIHLHYSISGKPRQKILTFQYHPKTQLITTPTQQYHLTTPPTDQSITQTINPKKLNLTPGNIISYFFTVTDNHHPIPNTTRSKIFFITILPDKQKEQDKNKKSKTQNPPSPKKQFSISALINESKRLIRLSWDTLSTPPQDQPTILLELQQSIADQQTNYEKKLNQLLILSQTPIHPLYKLLEQAQQQNTTAHNLLLNKQIKLAIPPQEIALAKLISLEYQLKKNKPKSKSSNKPISQSANTRQNQPPPAPNLQPLIQQLQTLTMQQQNLNTKLHQPQTKKNQTRYTASQQQIKNQTTQLQQKLTTIPNMNYPAYQLKAAIQSMESTIKQLQHSKTKNATIFAKRTHHLLTATLLTIQEKQKQQTTNQLQQLSQQSKKLANTQKQLAQQSKKLSQNPNPSKTQIKTQKLQQKQLSTKFQHLNTQLQPTNQLLQQTHPKIANQLQKIIQTIQQQKLANKMKQAKNALHYHRFSKASKIQNQIATQLQTLASNLQILAKQMPQLTTQQLYNQLQSLLKASKQLTNTKNKQTINHNKTKTATQLQILGKKLKNSQLLQLAHTIQKNSNSAPQLLQQYLQAIHLIQQQLAQMELQKQTNLNKQLAIPPEKYRTMVEQYFKDLSNDK